MKKIEDRLIKSRKLARYTQAILAKKIGFSEVSLIEWEKGRAEPKASAIEKWAKATNCNPGWLLTGEGPMESGDEHKTKIEGVQKSEEREIFEQTLYNYLDLILEKGDDDKRFDRIINDIWHLGEKLSNASEKESRIKRAIKKAIGG